MDREKMIPDQRVYATVDLDAVVSNMKAMKANLTKGTKMMGVVKADGYGHGAVFVAHAIEPYVEFYGVATAEEGFVLRRHGITKPILILGVVHERFYQALIKEEIRIPIFTWQQAEILSKKAVSMGKQGIVHLVLDTGMSRIGGKADQETRDLFLQISRLPGIVVEGLFTHFARADEADKESVSEQIKVYGQFVQMLKEKGLSIPVKHCSNSAGIIDLPEANWDMVREGISLYGLYPSDQVKQSQVALTPAMELNSFITYVKRIEEGTPVSYGGTFVAPKPMTVATVSVGYGDGYPRNLSGKGRVLIHGESARILGRVCMDQIVVDVTHIPEAKEWDQVTLLGRQNGEQILAEELAKSSGGFHYEIVCNIGKRVPRVYRKDGNVVGTMYFEAVISHV